MRHPRSAPQVRAERRAAPKPARNPRGGSTDVLVGRGAPVNQQRSVALGPHLRLQFEHDPHTGGGEWTATLRFDLPPALAADERGPLLQRLADAVPELYVELRCQGHAPVRATAHAQDEPSSGPGSARLLRFQLPAAFRDGLACGGQALLGCAHPGYHWRRVIPPAASPVPVP